MRFRNQFSSLNTPIPLSLLVGTIVASSRAKPAEAEQKAPEPVPSPVPVMNRAERRREKRRMKK